MVSVGKTILGFSLLPLSPVFKTADTSVMPIKSFGADIEDRRQFAYGSGISDKRWKKDFSIRDNKGKAVNSFADDDINLMDDEQMPLHVTLPVVHRSRPADVLLELLPYDVKVLQFAPPELRCDREFLFGAVQQDSASLNYASDALRQDNDFMMDIIRINGFTLQHMPDDYRSNVDFAMTAVTQNGLALAHVADELRYDREIILAAVRQNALALRFAPASFVGDQSLALEAAARHDLALVA